MKKLYFLDEEEKNRILNIHEGATKRQYLMETPLTDFTSKLPDETSKKFTAMNNSWQGGGTREGDMLNALKTFTAKDFNLYNQYLKLHKNSSDPFEYSSFQEIINGEMGKDNLQDVINITNQLKTIGVNATYVKDNIADLHPDSFKIGGGTTNTTIPTWATCAKQFGGTMEAHSDPTWVLIPLNNGKVGNSIWFKNNYNAMYRPGGGAQDINGTWACNGGKLTIKLDDKWTWNGKWTDPNKKAVVDPKKAYQERAKQVNQQTIDATKQIQQSLGVETPSGVLDSAEVETIINKLKQ